MSELINNHEFRQKKLKELIKRLHGGATVEEVKKEFEQLINGVSANEITAMEQALVDEGMEVEEIQRLCDVHASVFKGSIDEIHKNDSKEENGFEKGHPISTLKKENQLIEKLIQDNVLKYLDEYINNTINENKQKLKNALDKLKSIDKHYSRKEQLIFPYMEKYEMTAPAQVMWGVDDEIREAIKKALNMLNQDEVDLEKLNEKVNEAVSQVNEMIFKEENIMIPMLLEALEYEDWMEVYKGGSEIGYTLLKSVDEWETIEDKYEVTTKDSTKKSIDEIVFDAGSLTPEEINGIFNTVPIDMTFVDSNNKVKYFTQGKERIFDRPKTIIGREVKNCHPPKSVHIVEDIVEDLRYGRKDNEDFWIKMGDMFVYIRYFAVRNKDGKYLGTLEITQDIKPIARLEGEKRLRDKDKKEEK